MFSLMISALSLAATQQAFANDETIVSCSVGSIFDEPVWYGDLKLNQAMHIKPGTFEVTVSAEGTLATKEGTWSFGLSTNANPGYAPRSIGLVSSDVVVFGRGAVIYMELSKNLRIDCQIKE